MVKRQKRLKEVYEHLRANFGIHTQEDFANSLHKSRNAITLALNTPSTWYYGLNYQTGESVGSSTSPIVVNIPSSYIGTQNLVTSCYTVSGSSLWQTNITVSLIASDESSLGSVTIPDVPIKRNHITSYSGGIVGAGRSISVNASDDDWVDDGNVNW